jgi:hypothetical protein
MLQSGSQKLPRSPVAGRCGAALAGLSRYQADRRLPTDIDQGGLSPVDRQLVLNPLTVTLYEGGEMMLGSPASSFLPNAGNAPAVAEAYKGQEFHLVLGLQTGDDISPYRFTFVITDVRVR